MLDLSLTLLAISILGGICIGTIAGLLPGVHVNNTSAILLGVSPSLTASGVSPLYIAVVIIVSTVSQSFMDIIPSIFLGAPEEATVMAVMPGHRMLLCGKGIEAVRLAAMGSGLSICISMLLLMPLAAFFSIAYPTLQQNMALILILISIFVLLSNRSNSVLRDKSEDVKKVLWATVIFLICGILGMAAFSLEPLLYPLAGTIPPTMLLPLLSGLFGAPGLLMSLTASSHIPRQAGKEVTLPRKEIIKGVFLGTASGALVSWFPGVSSGVATTLTGIFSKGKGEDADKRYLVSVSGVNTASAIFSLVALFIIMRPRSGAVVAAQEVLGGSISLEIFMLLLITICMSGIVSYMLTVLIGSSAASVFSGIDYPLMNKCVLAFLVAMCLVMTGALGLVVFLISAMIGMAAYILEVRKTCLMGVLLMPCIVYFI